MGTIRTNILPAIDRYQKMIGQKFRGNKIYFTSSVFFIVFKTLNSV
jgi:hypothetical protein